MTGDGRMKHEAQKMTGRVQEEWGELTNDDELADQGRARQAEAEGAEAARKAEERAREATADQQRRAQDAAEGLVREAENDLDER